MAALPDKSRLCELGGRPYFRDLRCDPDDSTSVKNVALAVAGANVQAADLSKMTVAAVSGGITNKLMHVSGVPLHGELRSLLVRVFGAEGVIDRDVETAAFEALGEWLGRPGFLGRFGNGRCEEWLQGYRAMSLDDVRRPDLMLGIARAMARLHRFQIPAQLRPYFDATGAGFWRELDEWFTAAVGEETRAKVGEESEESAALYAGIDFSLVDRARRELKERVLGAGAETFRLCFCHNDLLPANLMLLEDAEAPDVRIIDLEYGGVNYAAFDVANHLMEFAGGTTPETLGAPDYTRLPTPEMKRGFVRAYLEALGEGAEAEDEFLAQVEVFAAVDNIYWGLWGVNQARIEGCREFPYLLYGKNRLARGLQDGGFTG